MFISTVEKKEIQIFKYCAGLSGLGIALALFLLYNYYAYEPSRICSVNYLINCKAVVKGGSLSTLFGVPVALYGLTGYLVLLFAAIFKKTKLVFATAAFGFLFCLRITLLEVFVVKVFCPICLACQSVMLVLFGLSIYLNFKLKK
jgi:uncharacterized membrane protein